MQADGQCELHICCVPWHSKFCTELSVYVNKGTVVPNYFCFWKFQNMRMLSILFHCMINSLHKTWFSFSVHFTECTKFWSIRKHTFFFVWLMMCSFCYSSISDYLPIQICILNLLWIRYNQIQTNCVHNVWTTQQPLCLNYRLVNVGHFQWFQYSNGSMKGFHT